MSIDVEPRKVTAHLKVTVNPGNYRSFTVGFDLEGSAGDEESDVEAMDRLRREISESIENAIKAEMPKYFG